MWRKVWLQSRHNARHVSYYHRSTTRYQHDDDDDDDNARYIDDQITNDRQAGPIRNHGADEHRTVNRTNRADAARE
jgi:hypothetical protein